VDVDMLYTTYDLFSRTIAPLQRGADWWHRALHPKVAHQGSRWQRAILAEFEAMGLSEITHTRPDFSIGRVTDSDGKTWEIEESVVYRTPFAQLICFRRLSAPPAPQLLLVSPMSGHFSTLLAGTVRTLVQDHDVFITDWLNPRDVPLNEGRFGLAEYVHHLIDFLRHTGPETHLMGVCQPTVACMAAAALMAEDNDPCEPASLILLAGPIDTRLSPTRVNELAKERPIDWFEDHLVSTVPPPHRGAGRRVYPGFVQLHAFMSMNRERHLLAFQHLKEHRQNGDHQKADSIAEFYREYFAVMDLPAEFYLETVQLVFQDHALPRGQLKVGERPVNCRAVRRPFLLTIEGERDDICGIGQTLAAQDLCHRMPMYKKSHLLQPGVGHYGVFNGRRWERRIYPVIRDFIQSTQ
jgi:poly(3-hydroxybutyrate) depolymerase